MARYVQLGGHAVLLYTEEERELARDHLNNGTLSGRPYDCTDEAVIAVFWARTQEAGEKLASELNGGSFGDGVSLDSEQTCANGRPP